MRPWGDGTIEKHGYERSVKVHIRLCSSGPFGFKGFTLFLLAAVSVADEGRVGIPVLEHGWQRRYWL